MANNTLGIDLGSTAVKCAIVDSSTGRTVEEASSPLQRGKDVATNVGEESVETILRSFQTALQKISNSTRECLDMIVICGQMHGIVWWNCAAVYELFNHPASIDLTSSSTSAWSHLITWQDQRCTPEFLVNCRSSISLDQTDYSPLASGYGIASYAHETQVRPDQFDKYDTCGTIMDLLRFILSGGKTPEDNVMDVTNAFSWGGLQPSTYTWHPQVMKALDIPIAKLPQVGRFGTICRPVTTSASFFQLPSDNVHIHLTLGDHPCSVLAALSHVSTSIDTNYSLINIGTSAQLAMIIPTAQAQDINMKENPSLEVRPFLSPDQSIGVAASLSGGNVMAWFVKHWLAVLQDLKGPTANLDEDEAYERIINAGVQHSDTTLSFSPRIYGERSDPSSKAIIQAITSENFSLGDQTAALCRGIVYNLLNMVPSALRPQLKQNPMIGTGNAMVKNTLLQLYTKEFLDDDSRLILLTAADAAIGAAQAPGYIARNKTS